MEEHVDTLMGIILPYANFFIFLSLAIFFFRKPAALAAKNHREQYQKLLSEATHARDVAIAKLAQIKEREHALADELANLKAVSKQSAEFEAQKMIQDAERLSQHLKDEASRIAQAEVAKARAALRQEIVETVSEGVKLRLQSDLNSEAQVALARKKISDLNHIGQNN